MKNKSGRFSGKLSFKAILLLLSLLVCVTVFLGIRSIYKSKDVPSLAEIYKDWEMGSYTSVYLKSEQVLKEYPFDADALALCGFSSYYIYIGESEEANNVVYLENTIISLRRALYFAKEKDKPKIAYILGKAYYQKGEYYADLALKYLTIAENSSLQFDDLYEFKGMANLALKNFDEATQSLSMALKDSPSPFLLYILGETYMKMEDFQNAKQYFFETITKTKDELLQLKCRYYIGSILLDEGELERAKIEFLTILEKDSSSADAHYGLGLALEKEGDIVKARSEWRKALKNNPSHEKTREKLKI